MALGLASLFRIPGFVRRPETCTLASSPQPRRLAFRINRRAVLVLAGLLLVPVLWVAYSRFAGPGRSRDNVLREIETLTDAPDDSKFKLAFRNLDQFLRLHPGDPGALVAQARLYGRYFDFVIDQDGSVDQDEVLAAIRVNDRVLRLLGLEHPEAEPLLRRQAYLYVVYSDSLLNDKSGKDRILKEQDIQQARYGAAREIAEDLVSKHPNDAEAHRLLGMALDGLAVVSKPDVVAAAFEAYHAALRLDPKDKDSTDRLARMYRDRYQGHDLPADERNRQTPESLRRLGRDRAHAALDALLVALPDDLKVRELRYGFYRESRADAGLAREELRNALKLAPGSGWVRLNAAEQAIRNNRPEEATEHLAAISPAQLEEGQIGYQARILGGLAKFADRAPDAALTQWRQGLIQTEGVDRELNWWMAYVQLRLGQLTDADPYINAYLRLSGGNEQEPGFLFLKALRLEPLGAWDEALRILDGIRFEATDPRLGQEIPLARGRCREALGDLEGALAAYRQAQAASPNSPVPQLSIASVQARQNPEQAISALRKALDASPGSPEILVALAQAHLLRLNSIAPSERLFAEVDELLDQLERLDPESTSLVLLRADRLILDPRSTGEASPLLEKAVARRPKDRSLWSAWANALAAEGKVAQALEVLERAAQSDNVGDHANIRLMRARLLVSLGRGREAQAALVNGSEDLPTDQQSNLLEALGRLRMGQGDIAGALQAYTRWAQIAPGAPKPLMAMIEASVRLNDRVAAERLCNELDGLDRPNDTSEVEGQTAPKSPAGKLARAMVTVAFAPTAIASSDPAARKPLNDALDILSGFPEPGPAGLDRAAADPAIFALRGQICERLARTYPTDRDTNLARAINNYREAWVRGIGDVLPRLVDLYARTNQIEELDKLAAAENGSAVSRRLSAEALLLRGQVDRGSELVNELAPTEPARGDAWRSRMLEMSGRFDELETELTARARAARPDDLDPWFRLIEFQADRGRSAEILDATIREFLGRARSVRPELLAAQAHRTARQWAAADLAYQKAATARAKDAANLSAVAGYYMETGRVARALELYRQALKLDPRARPISRQFATVLTGLGDPALWQEAWALVRPEATPGEQPEDRLARAVVLARSTDPAHPKEAMALLSDILADLDPAHPTAASARDYLTRLLLVAGEPQRAASYAAVSAARSGAAPDLALHAECLIAAKQFNEAETQLDQLFLLNPLNADEARLRARLLSERSGESAPSALAAAVADRVAGPAASALGRAAFDFLIGRPDPSSAQIDGAEQIARTLIPRDPGLGWMLGRVLLLRNRPAEVFEPCLAAASAPDTKEADRIQAAQIAMAAVAAAGETREAGDWAGSVVDAALKYTPDSADLLFMRGVICHAAGEFDREAKLYRRILELWPADRPEARPVLLNLAWLLSEQLGQAEEALPLVEGFLRRRPDDPDALGTRGVILLRLGRHDQAIADLERACSLSEEPRRLFFLARAYQAAGRTDQFRTQLTKIRRPGIDLSGLTSAERAELRNLATQ
jgi:tetratricopeptide (TPR) repeat protein